MLVNVWLYYYVYVVFVELDDFVYVGKVDVDVFERCWEVVFEIGIVRIWNDWDMIFVINVSDSGYLFCRVWVGYCDWEFFRVGSWLFWVFVSVEVVGVSGYDVFCVVDFLLDFF